MATAWRMIKFGKYLLKYHFFFCPKPDHPNFASSSRFSRRSNKRLRLCDTIYLFVNEIHVSLNSRVNFEAKIEKTKFYEEKYHANLAKKIAVFCTILIILLFWL